MKSQDKLVKNIPLILFILFFILPLFGKMAGPLFLALIIFGVIYYLKNHKINLNKFSNSNLNNVIDLDKIKHMQNTKRTVIFFLVFLIVAWMVGSSVRIIQPGKTGVHQILGKVIDKELSSGVNFVAPFVSRVTIMSIRTEEYTMSIAQGEGKRSGADAITSLTKEGLSVDLDMTVLYRIEEDKASDIYKNVGLREEIDEKIIRPSIRTSIRDIIAQYEAKDIYSEKRQEAASKIKEALSLSLEHRGIIVEDVLLRNVALPASLANAIQEKLQAEQEAQKYDFILQKEKKEKERKIIEAEGQRDAQKIINESLSTNYLYYQYINSLKDREGTVYVPTGTNSGMPLFRELGR
ncbi:prohibitin family protein [Candidatus Parcubacteria bacterium]|nr:prohibitin family protein [Candidatus Parcubacteria bacterium]